MLGKYIKKSKHPNGDAPWKASSAAICVDEVQEAKKLFFVEPYLCMCDHSWDQILKLS